MRCVRWSEYTAAATWGGGGRPGKWGGGGGGECHRGVGVTVHCINRPTVLIWPPLNLKKNLFLMECLGDNISIFFQF